MLVSTKFLDIHVYIHNEEQFENIIVFAIDQIISLKNDPLL